MTLTRCARATWLAVFVATATALSPAGAMAQSPAPVAESGAPARPAASSTTGPTRIVDDFERADRWKALPADGVDMRLSNDAGAVGRSIRIDFRFVKGGGYAVLRRDVALDLPANYRFTFRLRGEARPNNLEFKLVDSTGSNVWWLNRRNVEFPRAWDTQTIKKRHIEFAWGPAGGGEIRKVAAIEFAITAGSGGEGTVWLDELELTPLPPPPAVPPVPIAGASSTRFGRTPTAAIDGDSATFWASAAGDPVPWLRLDLGTDRELGGLSIAWMPGRHARDYVVETSDDGAIWRTVRAVFNGNGAFDDLRLPEMEARWMRLRVLRAAGNAGVAVRDVIVQPVAWGGTREAFYESIAKRSPRGEYPRAISGEQSYWTVIGADRDTLEALFDEDGNLEAGPGRWMIEPFVFADGRLLKWSDVRTTPQPAGANGATPSVVRENDRMRLVVRAAAIDAAAAAPERARAIAGTRPRVVATYELFNLLDRPATMTLSLAIRPFQVNPPAQFLNQPGGVGGIQTIDRSGRAIRVDGERGIVSLAEPSGFGAATFDQGDIVEFLATGTLPRTDTAQDPQGLASAAVTYRLNLGPRKHGVVRVIVPLHESISAVVPPAGTVDVDAAIAASWRDRAEPDRPEFRMTPDSDGRGREGRAAALPEALLSIDPTVRAILVNRDGAAIQPGSRAYARSWIRDGALTSSALLRLGHDDVVREFIEWFAPYQYSDGKVPCCVDRRGSDPVPEHDSHGEFIFLVAEYVRYTNDRELARRMWPHVRAAANAIDALRRERRGRAWRSPDKRHFYGLLPPSISHEGYSAKPMHSYWDDLFALRGLKDATFLADVLGDRRERSRLAKVRDEFQDDLAASVAAAMAFHRIDYVPGCADLGDFDATSTTIAFDPVQAEDVIPRAALERTFERYWQFFVDRRDGKKEWEAYTPYELRNVGAFVRLGWRDRASELLEFFFEGQRPRAWRQWPEVVWKDQRKPRFIGDLPHTWVGSDYVRSVLDMLAYTRERDGALVVGAGIPWDWIDGRTFEVRRLLTPSGPLGFTMGARGDDVTVRLGPGKNIPRGGLVVSPPFRRRPRSVMINGMRADLTRAGEAIVRKLPATVLFKP